jgi:hypothetical protein
MPFRLLSSLAATALLAASALAQPSPDPTNAAAPSAPIDYRSSFEGYQRYEAQKPAPWRSSNREVGAPVRDREAPAAAVPSPAAPPDRSVETAPAGGHAGHKR